METEGVCYNIGANFKKDYLKESKPMKKFTLAAFTAMLAVFAAHAADYYQFSVGQAIPLFDSEKSVLSHVLSGDNIGYESTEHFGSTQNGSSLTLYLKNETAGTYYLTLLGAHSNDSASSYTLTVENEDGTYKRESGKVVQPKTTGWAIVTPGGIKLDDLPAGNFTVKMEISTTSGSWAGNYGKFTIYKNVYDTSVNTGDNSVFVLDNDDTMTSNWYSPTGNSKDKQNEFGNFSSNPTISRYFYVAEKGVYEMSYSARVNDNEPTTAAWTLIGNGASAEFTDNIKTTGGNWENIAYYTNSVGVLSKGFYRVEGKITSNNAWRGYYGNFRFTQTAECKTVAADETWELEEDTTLAELTVGAGATIDLKGHDLTVMTITDADTASYTVTNSVEGENNLSVFTAATEGQPYSTLDAILTGNLKYVTMNGTTSALYMLFNTDRESGKENTLTGGMAVSNMTIDVQRNGFFGTGPLALVGGGYVKWTGDNVQGSLDNSIEVSGEGNKLEPHKGFTWSGALTGDGEVSVSCGFAPQLKFEGDTSAFTGKFICAYSPNSSQVNGDGGVYLGSSSHPCDLSKAEVPKVLRSLCGVICFNGETILAYFFTSSCTVLVEILLFCNDINIARSVLGTERSPIRAVR